MMGFVEGVGKITGAIMGIIGVTAAIFGAVSYFASLHQLKVARCNVEHALYVLDATLEIKVKKDELTKIDTWSRELNELEEERRPPNAQTLIAGWATKRHEHNEAIKSASERRNSSEEYRSSGRCEEDPKW